MENIQQMAEALPEEEAPQFPYDEDFHSRFPYDLREAINKAVFQTQLQELRPYAERRTTTAQETSRRRQLLINAQQMHNQNLTTTTLNIMNEAQQDFLEAQGESNRANVEYNRMMRVISHKITVYARLLRRRNEPPF